MLPAFEIVHRHRAVELVRTADARSGEESLALPRPAPFAAVTGVGTRLALHSGEVWVAARYEEDKVWLETTRGTTTTPHRSRRFARPEGDVEELGLTLTGTHVTAYTRSGGRWTARARHDLSDLCDTRDESWLAGLAASADGPFTAGGFGQLGLRDLRLVTWADGSPYRDDDAVFLTASSAGPGFFDTAHTSVWALDPLTLELEHRADLFFRRPDRPGVYGDHATHLVRDGTRWLVATSTWGDFDPADDDPSVEVTLATATADLLRGEHVLDTVPLVLPSTGLRSVGVWDPHLVRTDEGWLVGFVSATRFFRFHPVVAQGPSLDALTLRAGAGDRRATEGTTLLRLGDTWRVLASDGRDGRRGQREGFPVFDLDLTEVGRLDAAYPTNLPWPTLLQHGDGWLMIGFNGRPAGGRLLGYGTHGDVVFQRT